MLIYVFIDADDGFDTSFENYVAVGPMFRRKLNKLCDYSAVQWMK